MRTTLRPTADPEGRPVEVFIWPEHITLVPLAREYERAEIQSRIAQSLQVIATSTVKRLRERSLMVYVGRYILRDGKPVTVVGLPEPVAADTFRVVYEGLAALGVLDVGVGVPADVDAIPLFRYRAGQIVTYYNPFDQREHPARGDGFEIRSYEARERPEQREPALPRPATNAGKLHGLPSWSQLRYEIIRFIHSVLAAGTVRTLRRIVEDHFGIEVRFRPAAEFRHFGQIETGWLRADLTTTIRIHIRDDLADKQKYAVLAHELAHYVLHFPLLLVGQMVEQATWDAPGIEDVWHRTRQRVLGDLESWIEPQVTSLAVNLIIPAQVPLAVVADVVTEKQRRFTAEEVAWRFLQPYFPETGGQTYSWRNYEEMIERMRADLDIVNADDDDLSTFFYQFLGAAIWSESPDFERRNHTLEFRIKRLTAQMFAHLATLPRDPTGPSLDPSLRAGGELGQERIIHLPRKAEPGGRAMRRIPLVPLPGDTGRYVDPRCPGDSADLETWRTRLATDALVVYPYADLPDAPLWSLEDA